ncbi:MAG: tetratricopeptide repeat protein [Clostridia bacterium]|nr:tetratricopeptide repeat protein [Clostridia bacterium]
MTQANNYQKEILNTIDSYLHKNDYKNAEKQLLNYLAQAVENIDFSTEILLRNELMGLYRKLGRRDEAIKTVESVLNLIKEKKLQNNVGSATTYLNSATVYKAFGMPEKSIVLFEKAKKIYEEKLSTNDERLGGLYNNMALTLVDLKRFDEAEFLNKKAIEIMKNKPLEIAVTYLNMASAAEAETGLLEAHEKISQYLKKAKVLLEGYENSDGYYAFVCEKCASVFGYYGDFLYDEELQSRARRIYEGS